MNKPDLPGFQVRRDRLYPAILEALSKRTLSRKELNGTVRSLLIDDSLPYDRLFSGWGGVLKETNYLGLTVHSEICGRESCFARLDHWLPEIHLNSVSEREARKRLLMKYLHSHGPASATDFAYWSGLLTSEASTAIEDAYNLLKEISVDVSKMILYLLKKDFPKLQEIDGDESLPLRLLPKFDSYLHGHKDRARIIEPEFQKKVFRPIVGDIAATVLVNGRISGIWIREKTKNKMKVIVTSFRRFSGETIERLEETIEDLGRFLSVKQTNLIIKNQLL